MPDSEDLRFKPAPLSTAEVPSQGPSPLTSWLPTRDRRGSRPNFRTEEGRAPIAPDGEVRRAELPEIPSAPPQLLKLPQRSSARSKGTLLSFLICAVLPSVLAAGYYIGIAADQYVSEFKFVVRDAKSAAAGTSSNANAPLGLESLSSVGAGSVESYMVAEYIGSRQAVDALQEKIRIKQLYDKPDADWLSRFDSSRSTESFVKYWNRMVSATYDQVTGLGTAEVRAFSAEDAYAIATSLVALSEALVNDIANRPQQDAIRSAEKDVRRAEDRLTKVRTELAKFRNTENVIEPGANVVSSNVSLAQSLRTSISGIETELSALRRQKINPGSPVVSTLELRLRALRDQLTYVEKQVGSYNVDGKPLSAIVAAYEALDLERQFAQNMVLATMQNLEQARANAAMQHMYVATFVKPAMPQSPTYPRRTTAISLVVLASLLAWLVGLLIVDSIREHLT